VCKFKISLDAFSEFTGYMARIEARPAVKAALQVEGLELAFFNDGLLQA
jgi:glutathione S-transferase